MVWHDKCQYKKRGIPWNIYVLGQAAMEIEWEIEDGYIGGSRPQSLIFNDFENCETVEDAIKHSLIKHGKNASILILPNGPQILPFINI